jgi:uncharacterized protein
LVYDRQRNREIFDFDYTWEVYVPQSKRKWGYYVLPVLQDGKLISRIDPKLDRRSKTLQLLSRHDEPEVVIDESALETQIQRYAQFLGAEQLDLVA